MLQLSGRGSTHTCDGLTRRDFLQAGALGAIGLSLVDYAALKASGAVSKDHDERSVIMIFNLGAPSQLDIFDMKPEAAAEIRGPFRQIPTAVPAIGLSEILPKHARIADKFSLVRSCYHTAAAVHDTGHQMLQTGRLFTGGINTPHAGCVLSLSPRPAQRSAGPRAAAQADGSDRRQHAPRTGRRLPRQSPTIRSCSTPIRRSRTSRFPTSCRRSRSAKCRLARRRKLRDLVEHTVNRFETSQNEQLLVEQFRRGLPHHDQSAGAVGLRSRARTAMPFAIATAAIDSASAA